MPYSTRQGLYPPTPAKIRSTQASHGVTLVDDYAWMQDLGLPEVISHIDTENRYSIQSMSHTKPLRERIYQEMVSRLELNRSTVPVPHGLFLYYSRDEQEQSYPIHCRRRRGNDAIEEVLLDENRLALGKAYFSLDVFSISPDHSCCIYGFDDDATERLTLV